MNHNYHPRQDDFISGSGYLNFLRKNAHSLKEKKSKYSKNFRVPIVSLALVVANNCKLIS